MCWRVQCLGQLCTHHSRAPRPYRSPGLGEGSGGGPQGPRYLAAFSLDFRFLLCVTWMTSKVSLLQLSTARRLIRQSRRLPVHTPVSHAGLCTAAHCGTSRRPECQLWKCPLSPFSPPDRDRRGDSPAWSGRGSRPSRRKAWCLGRQCHHQGKVWSEVSISGFLFPLPVRMGRLSAFM